jgi:hypothetical protein
MDSQALSGALEGFLGANLGRGSAWVVIAADAKAIAATGVALYLNRDR